MLEVRVDLHVGDVDHRALEDCPRGPQGPGWTRREHAAHLLESFGGGIVLGDMMEQLAVEPIQHAEEAVA